MRPSRTVPAPCLTCLLCLPPVNVNAPYPRRACRVCIACCVHACTRQPPSGHQTRQTPDADTRPAPPLSPTRVSSRQMLASRMRAAIPDFAPRFLIDTGRNGVDSAIRQSCSNWCNIRGAGLGREPTAATELPGLVDVRRVHCEHALAQSHGRDRELTRSDRERGRRTLRRLHLPPPPQCPAACPQASFWLKTPGESDEP